jgi:hypothetical protein
MDQYLSQADSQAPLCNKVSDDVTSVCSTASGDQELIAQNEEIRTLSLIDWDDTLFPTSWLLKEGLFTDGKLPSCQQAAQLQQLAEGVKITLETAVALGKVVIVTNAEQGWIERSCTRFMPSLVNLLKTIDIVSAQSSFKQLTQEPSEWKRLAFQHELGLFHEESTLAGQQCNLVSMGDSEHELAALLSVTKGVANCYGKSVKLMESPRIEQLIEQHEVLSSSLSDVVEHDGDLDIMVGSES